MDGSAPTSRHHQAPGHRAAGGRCSGGDAGPEVVQHRGEAGPEPPSRAAGAQVPKELLSEGDVINNEDHASDFYL